MKYESVLLFDELEARSEVDDLRRQLENLSEELGAARRALQTTVDERDGEYVALRVERDAARELVRRLEARVGDLERSAHTLSAESLDGFGSTNKETK